MTYVSKKEKVFDLPDQDELSSISLTGGDKKLKSFLSVSDRRAWTSEEFQRYQHLYGLVKDSESSISKSSSFKYIPFDVLLAILMAEKDAYIQELLERQDDNRSYGGKANLLYKSDGFDDSDDDREALIRKDAEVVALKNKIVVLGSQIEDYKETLTKAMHKLENLDSVMSENNYLREKIKCSEEAIRCLEGKKEELERELEYYRLHFNAPEDLEMKQFYMSRPPLDGGDCEQIVRLSSEKDILIRQIEELQKELERSRADAAEVEVLRKVSETTSSNLEEISKENECYKAKLESMKCLEMYVEELKKQAHGLTDKYKRESQKANDQLKQININKKELQLLREERDKLNQRVNELTVCENQYLALKGKLQQVDLIIDENEMLNKKLLQLDRLELENEQLKLRIEQMKTAEFQALEDKKLIFQLQGELAEQEEEIKRMIKHIEDLSSKYPDDEIYQLQMELEDKNGKLKKYERQLDDIPLLESEIEELKHKLQKCIDDFSSDKILLGKLQDELEACRSRCHELEQMAPLSKHGGASGDRTSSNDPPEITEIFLKTKQSHADKGVNTIDVLKEEVAIQLEADIHEDKSTFITDEAIVTLQHVEEQNKILKHEVSSLTLKLSKIDLDELIAQTNDLKCVLRAKDDRIGELDSEVNALQIELESYKNLKQSLEKEVELYKERAEYMITDLRLKDDHINAIEETVVIERKERVFAKGLIDTLEGRLEAERVKREAGEAILKLQKEESNLAKQEIYAYFAVAIEQQNGIARMSTKLNEELQTENELLREIKEYMERCENKALKNLVARLRAEVRVLMSLSKPELESECEALQHQVKALLKETDSLIEEIRELKAALDSEKTAKDFLEREVMNLQAELSACVTAGNEIFGRELSAKEVLMTLLRKELEDTKKELETFIKESQDLREKNEKLAENIKGLELEQKELKNEVNLLKKEQEELNKIIKEYEEREKENLEKFREFEEVCGQLKSEKEVYVGSLSLKECEMRENLENMKLFEEVCLELRCNRKELILSRESVDRLQERVRDLEEKLKVGENILKSKEESLKAHKESVRLKDEELEVARNASMGALNELNRLTSEVEVLRKRLAEKENEMMQVSDYQAEDGNYESDLQEKFALEEALRKMESELDDLKTKLEECRSMEIEMANLRRKRDSLLEKMSGFESEIDRLKKKLSNFESLKDELEKLKSKDPKDSGDLDATKLQEELLLHKLEIENLKTENTNLKEELNKKDALMEIRKNLPKVIPDVPSQPGMEFYTPPALPSPRSSGPQDVEYILLATHKKEIADLENMYKLQLRGTRETNAERLKKLTEHYEKESKSRTKSFSESLNSVRSSYESDIKKLVERHKVSIMRLQGLHEDEVQELNTTYETQMEAMQTQNENLVNDMRTEATEKYQQLREQHNRDLRELSRKYEDVLRESEARLEEERKNSKAKADTPRELDLKENLTQFYQTTIAEMEEKHSQEMKKCRKSNLKRIELMKNKYEALLVEERKKYEEQLEEMLLRLKSGSRENSTEPSRETNIREGTPTANPSLEFTEVLHKILNEGLECLSFEELILVHSKTCFIPENCLEGDSGVGEYSPRLNRCCKHRELMAAEKEELLKRIFTLEHEMVIKQLETHEAIVNMEAAEFCRIRELKSALCTAQQKNAELKRLLSDQSKNEMGLKIDRYMSDKQASFHETNVVEKVREIEREKAEKRRLEEELQKERATSRNLATLLEAEKERHMIQRKRDADYVESIRQRLEEALSHEQKMETQLDYEVKLRSRLETELQTLRNNLNFHAEVPPILQIDVKAVKDIKNQDQSEVSRRTRHSRSKSKRSSKVKSLITQ